MCAWGPALAWGMAGRSIARLTRCTPRRGVPLRREAPIVPAPAPTVPPLLPLISPRSTEAHLCRLGNVVLPRGNRPLSSFHVARGGGHRALATGACPSHSTVPFSPPHSSSVWWGGRPHLSMAGSAGAHAAHAVMRLPRPSRRCTRLPPPRAIAGGGAPAVSAVTPWQSDQPHRAFPPSPPRQPFTLSTLLVNTNHPARRVSTSPFLAPTSAPPVGGTPPFGGGKHGQPLGDDIPLSPLGRRLGLPASGTHCRCYRRRPPCHLSAG